MTVPLSEDRTKITDAWGRDECIGELRRIAEAEPDKVITRNYFRVHGQIAESVWNRHFGTFLEFKRAAGIILSRHQNKMERDIARHASKDRLNTIDEEKRSYEGAYRRPHKRRFQSVLVASDIHDKNCDPFYRRLLVETALRVRPESIVLNGDLFDLPEFSRYTQDPRIYKANERILWVHRFLGDLRAAAPDAEITLVAGNHEERLHRHLAEATPALLAVLNDLHGMTIADLLGLKKFEVNYISRADLSVFNESDLKQELKKNYLVLHDCVLFHHFPEGFRLGYPGANGHHHRHLVRAGYSPTFGAYEWHQTGSGHVRRATYCAGEQWSTGFLLCHVDRASKRTAFEYVDCTHAHAVIGGKFYLRSKSESLPE